MTREGTEDKSNLNDAAAIRLAVRGLRTLTVDHALSRRLFALAEREELPTELRSLLIDCSRYAAGMFEEDPWYRQFDPADAAHKAHRLLDECGI